MQKKQLKFVLSTVGISVLLNTLDRSEGDLRQQLINATNSPSLDRDLMQQVDALAERALERLKQGNAQDNRNLSAELNGLYGIYEDRLSAGKEDFHYLIATDTALGKKAAEVIRDFLRASDYQRVDIYTPPALSTSNSQDFSKGIKELIKWCQEVIPEYRDEKYYIIFNLTGAFKGLQGYLSIMGMFYADEIVYIFERSELLRIPRLPLQIDIDALHRHRAALAMMAQGHVFPLACVSSIPDSLLEIDDNENVTLSNWGELVWQNAREKLLGKDLIKFPRLCYEDKFRKDFENASVQERVRLQETLAKVAGILEYSNGDTSALKRDGGLQYEVYENKYTKDGKPIAHFRVSRSHRVTCVAEGGTLYLRRYGEHSINDNP